MLRTVQATRYVAPLREGGSMPALVEADDDGLYVVKLRGAGQGSRTLVAEVLAGELARALGLRVPELVLVDVDVELARAEPDPEIQELVQASGGLNAGLDFLPGALPYAPAAGRPPAPDVAAAVVWLDALVENVDRTPRNPNLLVWHGELWLIDHGAALFRQHGGLEHADPRAPFPLVADHVLLDCAGPIGEADERLAPLVHRPLLERVVAAIPADWFAGTAPAAYVDHLLARAEAPRAFAEEAERARRR
ncbi:MAG TPA: HipA family kinase [Baekduia sp.]|nr:HipA family kinase [Baekduia sp.]